jgi:GNAT superfamily N-acetyltransferase
MRPPDLLFRIATSIDVPKMAECRLRDPAAGPADPRMAAYLNGWHHPQQALPPRTGFVAESQDRVVGYIAGHLSTRHQCQAEVQYLFVDPQLRRLGIASDLLRWQADWFVRHGATRVCVCVDGDSPAAKPFYAALGARPLSPSRPLWYVWEDLSFLAKLV